MAKRSAAEVAPPENDEIDLAPASAEILELDGVAERRERLAAYVASTRQAIAYEFSVPAGALVETAGGEQRDAEAQLHLAVALTGGSVGKFPGGLVARVPAIAAGRFEILAKPLIQAFLIGWRV